MSEMQEFREKVLTSLERIETTVGTVVANDQDKEKRLRSLERWRWSHVLSGGIVLATLAKLGIHLPTQG
jgi:hypothetical protein